MGGLDFAPRARSLLSLSPPPMVSRSLSAPLHSRAQVRWRCDRRDGGAAYVADDVNVADDPGQGLFFLLLLFFPCPVVGDGLLPALLGPTSPYG